MLKSKTVFVIGAGASHEVGLPVGRTLRRIVYDKLDFRVDRFGPRDGNYGDSIIFEWIRRRYGNSSNKYFLASARIRAGILLSASIDDFLDVHQHDSEMVECGKFAIAQAILEAEKSSPLSLDTQNPYHGIDFARLENTWYLGFFQLLHQGLSKNERAEIFKNTVVVSFNYDRCIEHFLVHALAAHYQIAHDEARELVRQLPIYRPYGSVGDYLGPSQEQVPFGTTDIRELDRLTKNIRTYTEQIEDTASVGKLQAAVRDARVIVFLGNAFHSNNMKLVTPSDTTKDQDKDIYFTRSGVSDGDLQVVMKLLMRLRGTIVYNPVPHDFFRFTDTCYKLFEEFRLSLRQ